MKTFIQASTTVTLTEIAKSKNAINAFIKFISLTALFLVHAAIFAQAPSWQWANSANGTGSNSANDIITDAAGNTYITGSFEDSTILFGSVTLTSAGAGDIYFAKYDSTGNLLLAQSAGGSAYDQGSSIYVDASGNIYLAGTYSSPTISFGNHTLVNSSGYDMFMVKYDASGAVLWANTIGGNFFNKVNRITADNNGNVYLTGAFGDYSAISISFGGIVVSNNGGWLDIFVAKYDPSGNAIWAKSYGSSGSDYGSDLKVDVSGNVYLTGNFAGYNASGTQISFGNTTLVTTGYYDFFVAKFSSSGNVLWANGGGGADADEATGVAIDANGNSYITGSFESALIVLGSNTLTNTSYTGSWERYTDLFTVKYDSFGNILWAKSNGGVDYEYSPKITADANGNTYLTGTFYSSTLSIGTTTLTNVGKSDIFITKNDPSGQSLWAKSVGGFKWDNVYGIALDHDGNTYITGTFFRATSITFGDITLTNPNNTENVEDGDIFVARLNHDNLNTGISETPATTNQLYLFPNPANDRLFVRLDKNYKGDILMIDVLGKVVKQLKPEGIQTTIDISDLNEGVYFVKIAEENSGAVQKIIVKR